MVAAPKRSALREVRMYMPLVSRRRTFCLVLGSIDCACILLQRRNPGTHYLRQKCALGNVVCLLLNSGIVDEAREVLLQTTIRLRSILSRCNFLLGLSIARGFF